MSRRLKLGKRGESWAARWLLSAGWWRVLPGEKNGGDLKIVDTNGEVYKVEVKTARERSTHGFAFTVWNGRHCDARKSDYLLLQAVSGARITRFMIPTSELGDRRQVYIGKLSTYNGLWAKYRIQER